MGAKPVAKPSAALLLVLLATLSLAACEPTTGPLSRSIWTAEIHGSGQHLMLSGSAAAISEERARRTRLNVRIEGGPAGATLPWRVRSGACGSGGDALGAPAAYTALQTDEVGGDEKEVLLNQPMLAGSVYSVEVWRAPGDETVIACGTFAEQ